MTTHTPTPWHLGKNAPDYRGHCTIRDKEGWEIAQIPGLPPPATHPRQEVNARFIVTACNAHDALVAALYLAKVRLEGGNAEEQAFNAGIVTEIKAALALADGKERT